MADEFPLMSTPVSNVSDAEPDRLPPTSSGQGCEVWDMLSESDVWVEISSHGTVVRLQFWNPEPGNDASGELELLLSADDARRLAAAIDVEARVRA